MGHYGCGCDYGCGLGRAQGATNSRLGLSHLHHVYCVKVPAVEWVEGRPQGQTSLSGLPRQKDTLGGDCDWGDNGSRASEGSSGGVDTSDSSSSSSSSSSSELSSSCEAARPGTNSNTNSTRPGGGVSHTWSSANPNSALLASLRRVAAAVLLLLVLLVNRVVGSCASSSAKTLLYRKGIGLPRTHAVSSKAQRPQVGTWTSPKAGQREVFHADISSLELSRPSTYILRVPFDMRRFFYYCGSVSSISKATIPVV